MLSRFLSPLFDKRTDDNGGPLANRMRLVPEVVRTVRATVGPTLPVATKPNATDRLEGGFAENKARAAA